MDLKAIIDHGFAWSNNEVSDKPVSGWNNIKHHPDVIPVLKEIIKERRLQDDALLVFHWWMGVTLDVIPSQL